MRAQIGSTERGRQRLIELCQEYGVDEVLSYADQLIAYSDLRMGQEISSMPDGISSDQSDFILSSVKKAFCKRAWRWRAEPRRVERRV